MLLDASRCPSCPACSRSCRASRSSLCVSSGCCGRIATPKKPKNCPGLGEKGPRQGVHTSKSAVKKYQTIKRKRINVTFGKLTRSKLAKMWRPTRSVVLPASCTKFGEQAPQTRALHSRPRVQRSRQIYGIIFYLNRRSHPFVS